MHRLMKLSVRQNLTGWVFVAPAAALIFIFNFYPIVRAFLLSLQTGVGVNLQYVGLGQLPKAVFRQLVSDGPRQCAHVFGHPSADHVDAGAHFGQRAQQPQP